MSAPRTVALAFLLAAACYLAERRLDFTIGEEGFLWYGAIQAEHGEVPLRDFYSYDPGRYYWAALWSPVAGDGLLGLRFAAALFSALGLACGLLAARRAVRNPWLLAATGILLLVWMVPRNKVFEPSLALAAIWCAAALVERPSPWRHFGAGLLTGIALFFGKNHGLYLALAFLLLIALVTFRLEPPLETRRGAGPLPPTEEDERESSGLAPALRRPLARRQPAYRLLVRRLLAWGAGLAAGASPLLVMLAAVPGFARGYFDSIRFFVEEGQTNFALPIPWPWHAATAGGAAAAGAGAGTVAGTGAGAGLYGLAFGLPFLLMPLLYLAALALGWSATPDNLRQRALLVACGAVGIFYLHHALSRADFHHLAQSIHPFLLGMVALPAALPAAWRRAAAGGTAALLAALTLPTVPREHPLYRQLTAERPPDRFIPCRIGGDEISMRAQKARLLASFVDSIAANVPAGEPILIAPQLPGLYAVTGKTAPVWDIYPIWPARGRLDQRMLRELQQQDVKWALVEEAFGLDGRQDLHFGRTHPETWRYLTTRFDRLPSPRLPDSWWLLQRRDAAAAAPPTPLQPSGPPGPARKPR
jgi:hypothetical protein